MIAVCAIIIVFNPTEGARDMSDIEFPVRTLFQTSDIRDHFGCSPPHLLPVVFPDVLDRQNPHNVILQCGDPLPMPTRWAMSDVMGVLALGGKPEKTIAAMQPYAQQGQRWSLLGMTKVLHTLNS